MISFLKLMREFNCFSYGGKMIEFSGPRYEIISLPYYTLRAEGILKSVNCCKLNEIAFADKKD